MSTFPSVSNAGTNPYVKSVTVTASNDTAFAPSNAIHVGTGGNLVVEYLDGSTDTWTAVPNNTILPIRVVKIRATGTTASVFKVLY
jgi:hypothetical protein